MSPRLLAAALRLARILTTILLCVLAPASFAQRSPDAPDTTSEPAAEASPETTEASADVAEASADVAQASADVAEAAAKVAEAAPNADLADPGPYSFLGVSWIAWSMAVGVAVISLVLLLIVRGVLRNRAQYLAKLRPNPITEGLVHLVSATSTLVLIVVALAIGAIQLPLPNKAEHAVRIAVIVAVAIQAIFWGRVFIDIGLQRLLASKKLPDGKPDPSLLSAMIPLKFIATLILVAIIALIALDNAGVDVTALVAGLGVGGIAIALAVQSILGDLFSAVSIVIDKPFVVGDFIIVGDKMGTVETIGLKTTRVRALSGEQLVFANSDLLSSRIQNFKRMVERRVVIGFGVTYQTSPQELRAIPAMVREAVEHNKLTRFDRCHFNKFADSSLNFELVYYVLDSDFNKHADIQQAVLLEIFEKFTASGIDFAYPTQTVYEFKLPKEDIKSPLRAPVATSAPGLPAHHPNDDGDDDA
jgi:small-conductance mechanosensitive channel